MCVREILNKYINEKNLCIIFQWTAATKLIETPFAYLLNHLKLPQTIAKCNNLNRKNVNPLKNYASLTNGH